MTENPLAVFPNCWVIAQDAAGMINQGLGLAEAMGYHNPPLYRIDLKTPWRWLPVDPLLATLSAVALKEGEGLRPPWPDLIISSGRKGAFTALAIKKASKGKSRVINIQDPRGRRAGFDVLVVPQHDPAHGGNVIRTPGALHRLNSKNLAQGAISLEARLQGLSLPRPWISVLLGGPAKGLIMSPEWGRDLSHHLNIMARAAGGSLLITGSRRTPPETFHAVCSTVTSPHWAWDGKGENPIYGLLGGPDLILTTQDSVSMISEACSTGKPVMILPLLGRSSRRIDIFNNFIINQGFAKKFSDQHEVWSAKKLIDMDNIALAVWSKLGV